MNPIGDRIIIKPHEVEEQTAGGLFVVKSAVDTTPKGTVIAVGPGRTTSEGVLIKPEVSVDDVVMFSRDAGVKVKHENNDYLIMTEDQILGILS